MKHGMSMQPRSRHTLTLSRTSGTRSNSESCIGFLHCCMWLIWHTPMSHMPPPPTCPLPFPQSPLTSPPTSPPYVPTDSPQSLERGTLQLGKHSAHAHSNDGTGAGYESSGTLPNMLKCVVLGVLQHLTAPEHPALQRSSHIFESQGLSCIYLAC